MPDPRHRLGQSAEDAVAQWLAGAGWRILDRRWRSAGGELDLVCLDPTGCLVGVEVKARRTTRAGRPEDAADPRRIARLRRALADYARGVAPPHATARIDLVALTPAVGDGSCRWRLERLPGVDGW